MTKNKKRFYILLLTLSMVFVIYISTKEYAYVGLSSNKERSGNAELIEIKRKKYLYRNLLWSGIFPFGSFIPDPHFDNSRVYQVPSDIQIKYNLPNLRLQLTQINNWFKNEKYRESLIVIEDQDNKSHYELFFADDLDITNYLTDMFLNIFYLENRILINLTFTHSDVLTKKYKQFERYGLVQIPLPLSSDSIATLYHMGTEEFQVLYSELIKNYDRKELQKAFCASFLRIVKEEKINLDKQGLCKDWEHPDRYLMKYSN